MLVCESYVRNCVSNKIYLLDDPNKIAINQITLHIMSLSSTDVVSTELGGRIEDSLDDVIISSAKM